MDSEKEKQILKERDEKRLLTKRKAIISEEQPSKKVKLRTETVDELRNYLRIVDFEKSVHDRESLEGISMITELQVIDSPDGEYLIIHRANNHFRAFDTLWEILHILDRQDLYHPPWVTFQDTQTDCVQDTAQRMKLKRLKASTALMTRQTDAEQRRPTIKKLEVKQVEFKLGEDCWDIQDKSLRDEGVAAGSPKDQD
ncbi:hypothetical protein Tco_0508692 [Tanacetum coccineum]